MPRFPTFPTLYDEVKTLSIADLKRLGYLIPDQKRSGVVTWTRREKLTGSIRISADLAEKSGTLELSYSFGEEPIKYKVALVTVPSNLGKGLVWYFRCPYTGKRCRKLYGIGKYFLHREAFQGCMYESQTRSKSWRRFRKTFTWVFEAEDIEEELRQKYKKRHYRGKLTPLRKKLDMITKEGAKNFLMSRKNW